MSPPFHQFESDRICAIKVALPNSKFLTILGVYMPSADQSQEIYSSYLDALSSAISELLPDYPLLIVGDLNCHLGHLGGPRSTDLPNARGHLWKELIDHESLFAPSLCQLASGPIHTYHSGLCSRQSCPRPLLNIVCHLWGSSSEYFGPCPTFHLS